MFNMCDFSYVGGLEKHIKVVKEMVLFPLIYSDIYAKFNLRPPRGLLFYGPPGTGKTLVASALAVECSNLGKKVSFISRKGSDCLSKYVGESEKKLQKIFQMAQQTKPCIIFFDEVDGLAPVRTSRQDYIHASVVSILLALMDGLDNNSEIIVIGATNRLDAIDPALRRPGRFDRELYFPLPCYRARKDILSVYIRSWKHKPSVKFLSYIASKTIGYCGSDLQALCAEAVMCCVRRQYPQIYTTASKLNIDEKSLEVEKRDFIEAQMKIIPAHNRITTTFVKKLSPFIYPLLQKNVFHILNRLYSICTPDMLPFEHNRNVIFPKSVKCPRILIYGKDDCHTRHIAPALLHAFEHLPCHVLDIMTLFEETGRSLEESIIQKIKIARHTLPSLLYIPSINTWWNLVDEATRLIFLSLMKGLDNSTHILVLMTMQSNFARISKKILQLFDDCYGELYEIKAPDKNEKIEFFKQLFFNLHSTTNEPSNESDIDFIEIMQSKKVKKEENRQPNTDSIMNLKTNSTVSFFKITNQNIESPLRVSKRKAVRSHDDLKQKQAKLDSKIFPINRAIGLTGLSEIDIETLLKRIVEFTQNWLTLEIEHLYSKLEIIVKANTVDIFKEINDCLNHYVKMNFD